MALRLSTALRNAILEQGSLKRAMSNCVLKIYTGAQPSSADAAPTGTLLCTYSKASGTLTRETLGVGSLTLAGTSGSADTLTYQHLGAGATINLMDGTIASDGTVAGTATLVAANINNNPLNIYFDATTTGASGVITFTCRPGIGASLNTGVFAGTGTTITFGTPVAVTGGVTAVNALRWGDSAAGVLIKDATKTWSGVAVATGTAGWFRFEAAVTDGLALDSTESVKRMDGGGATSGSELNLSSTSIVNTATQTVDAFTVTFPQTA